jgi:hypothetical protein
MRLGRREHEEALRSERDLEAELQKMKVRLLLQQDYAP